MAYKQKVITKPQKRSKNVHKIAPMAAKTKSKQGSSVCGENAQPMNGTAYDYSAREPH